VSRYNITLKGDKYWVANPVMPEENFADKWNEEPVKRMEFERWLRKAKEELITQPFNQIGLNRISSSYQMSLGENITKKAFASVANEVNADRETGKLYVSGVSKHITTQSDTGARKIQEHTFFGK
jgi:hypothetical protein